MTATSGLPATPVRRRRHRLWTMPGWTLRAGTEPIEERDAQADVARRERTYRRLLLAADVAAVALALGLAARTLGAAGLDPLALLALPLVVVAAKVGGLYDRDELVIRKSSLEEAPELLHISAVCALVVWLADGVRIATAADALEVAALWGVLFAAAFAGRVLARRVAARITPVERCLFIGDAETYARLGTKLEDADRLRLVGRMSLRRPARGGARNAGAEELGDLLAWAGVHRVIIEPQALPHEEMHDLVRVAKSVGVRVSLVPRLLDVVGTSVVFDEFGGMTVLGLRRFALSRSSRRVKRAFDIVGATVAVLAFAPVMAAIAVALVLDRGGPVLVRREYADPSGRALRTWRFRRASWLRATSLDTLPQLFSVLAGTMSLVGPQPLPAVGDGPGRRFDRRRLALTPGIAGHWQILGSSHMPLQEMLKIDYLYVAGWSVWSDVKILLRSLPYLLARR